MINNNDHHLPFTCQGTNLMISFDPRRYEDTIEDFKIQYPTYFPILEKSLSILYKDRDEKPPGCHKDGVFICDKLEKVSIRHVAKSYMENITQRFIKQRVKCSKSLRRRKFDFILILDDGQEIGAFVMTRGFLYLSKFDINYPIRLVEHSSRYVENKDYLIMQKILRMNKKK